MGQCLCQWAHYSDEVCSIATVDISNASTVSIRRYDTILVGSHITSAGLKSEERPPRCNSGAQAAPVRLSRSSRYSEERNSKHAAVLLYVGGLWVVAPSNAGKVKPAFA